MRLSDWWYWNIRYPVRKGWDAVMRRTGIATWACERWGHRLGPITYYSGSTTVFSNPVQYSAESGRCQSCYRCGESFYTKVWMTPLHPLLPPEEDREAWQSHPDAWKQP